MKYLIVGPGGVAYLAFFGYVMRLHETGELDDLQEISSAGAMVAAVYLIGRATGKLEEFRDEIIRYDIRSAMRYNIRNIFKKFGFVNSGALHANAITIINDVAHINNITFRELWELIPIKLHIPSFSLLRMTNEYFSVDSHPDMPVVDAVMASISIPIIIPPFKGQYIDGSIIEDIPYMPFVGYRSDDITAIALYDVAEGKVPKTLKEYLGLLMYIMSAIRHQNKCIRTKFIHVPNVSGISFEYGIEKRLEIYSIGYSSAI
jgi:predicted acylesterase/phospholipase RssA